MFLQGLESDLMIYGTVLTELGHQAEKIHEMDAKEGQEVQAKQVRLEQDLDKLRAQAEERRFKLEATKAFHEYARESGEVEEWIAAQMQTASSEDYGQDYEHLQVRYFTF